jgi:regulator of cell morphogenesis and NO signaling
MSESIATDATLADIVTRRPGLARELERRSLDYCCGGQRTLSDACAEAGLDPEATAAELSTLAGEEPVEWAGLGLGELADHLEKTHHQYLHEEMPRLSALAAKVAEVHGANHPELADVKRLYATLRAELEPHLEKEEMILFPMIRELAEADDSPQFHCGSLLGPIRVMSFEHDTAGELLAQLREVTSNYTPPADGCASYQALYAGLAELEADTHLHIHKENNLLFPTALEMENRLAQAGA